jgi:hypothetical protein
MTSQRDTGLCDGAGEDEQAVASDVLGVERREESIETFG